MAAVISAERAPFEGS